MKKLLLATAAIGSLLAAAAPADARQGCGPGGHRGPNGHCRPNHGRMVAGPALRIGVFYPGHGYWDGHRYWQHRERWHHGWRYR
jgi:hypothetical protein